MPDEADAYVERLRPEPAREYGRAVLRFIRGGGHVPGVPPCLKSSRAACIVTLLRELARDPRGRV